MHRIPSCLTIEAMRWAGLVVMCLPISPCLSGCGEGAVQFRGTVTAGDVAGHHFDEAANPDGRPPIEGVEVFARMRGEFFENCNVDAGAKPRAVSDAQGVYDTDVIGFGPDSDALTWQICFRKAGFSSYEVRINVGENAYETNGTRFMNVVMVASE